MKFLRSSNIRAINSHKIFLLVLAKKVGKGSHRNKVYPEEATSEGVSLAGENSLHNRDVAWIRVITGI